MKKLELEATYNSPRIDFDPDSGNMEMAGRSIPEHANLFYQGLIEWAKRYAETNPPKTKVQVKIDYLNSSSHKFLMELFEKLEPIHIGGNDIIVDWYYEQDDEEMRETGEEYNETVNVPFNIIEVEEFD